jgi:hypothetical protein
MTAFFTDLADLAGAAGAAANSVVSLAAYLPYIAAHVLMSRREGQIDSTARGDRVGLAVLLMAAAASITIAALHAVALVLAWRAGTFPVFPKTATFHLFAIVVLLLLVAGWIRGHIALISARRTPTRTLPHDEATKVQARGSPGLPPVPTPGRNCHRPRLLAALAAAALATLIFYLLFPPFLWFSYVRGFTTGDLKQSFNIYGWYRQGDRYPPAQITVTGLGDSFAVSPGDLTCWQVHPRSFERLAPIGPLTSDFLAARLETEHARTIAPELGAVLHKVAGGGTYSLNYPGVRPYDWQASEPPDPAALYAQGDAPAASPRLRYWQIPAWLACTFALYLPLAYCYSAPHRRPPPTPKERTVA